MILTLLLFAQVADYHQLPEQNAAAVVSCNAAVADVRKIVGQYHGFVNRHQIDEGGKLTRDEAIVYKGEADRYVARTIDRLNDLRFTASDPRICTRIGDDMTDGLLQDVIARRFGPSFGYVRRPDGRWRKR